MLRCPEAHDEGHLVLSTGEIKGRMVRSGILGCPKCHKEYPIVKGVVNFSGGGRRETGTLEGAPSSPVDAQTLQALLDLSGPGGYVVLVGSAARHAAGLAGAMGGIHFVGVNAPGDAEELAVLSLLACETMIPLRGAMGRGIVIGAESKAERWLDDARRVLLRGRRLVVEGEYVKAPEGMKRLAMGQGLWVGERG
jgi:uncharacterized protein YbaR (Trm112 family)